MANGRTSKAAVSQCSNKNISWHHPTSISLFFIGYFNTIFILGENPATDTSLDPIPNLAVNITQT
jgi:hypothetical protein